MATITSACSSLTAAAFAPNAQAVAARCMLRDISNTSTSIGDVQRLDDYYQSTKAKASAIAMTWVASDVPKREVSQMVSNVEQGISIPPSAQDVTLEMLQLALGEYDHYSSLIPKRLRGRRPGTQGPEDEGAPPSTEAIVDLIPPLFSQGSATLASSKKKPKKNKQRAGAATSTTDGEILSAVTDVTATTQDTADGTDHQAPTASTADRLGAMLKLARLQLDDAKNPTGSYKANGP